MVTAPSGGVGLHTLLLARFLGLRVIAVTTSERKADMLLDAGAHHVLTMSADGFHRGVRELTGGAGADAVIEIAGVPTFPSSLRSLAAGGRLVAVGNMQPDSVPFNPAVAILKEIEVVGSGHALVADLARLIDLVARGLVHPRISELMSVAEAAKAHEKVAGQSTNGRIVLTHRQAVS